MNEIVKYDNDLNLVAFKNFNKVENDVFFSLMWKLKEQQNKEVKLTFSELRRLINLRNMTNKEIEKSITDIGRKISSSLIELETETERQFFTIFQVLAVPKNTDDFYIRAKINEPFLYILNNFENGGFTMFELMEFSNLSSRYTQTLYRLLKQFRSTGYLKIKWDKFIALLDIPNSYNMGTIDNQILKPSIKELSENTLFSSNRVIFKNLKMKKIRGVGRGRPVTDIEFTFRKEDTDNKNEKLEKKTKKQLQQNRKEQEFKEQFYGKKFELDDVIHTCLNLLEQDDKLVLETEYYNKGLIRKNIKFDRLNQIKELIKDYEKNNQVKERTARKNMLDR